MRRARTTKINERDLQQVVAATRTPNAADLRRGIEGQGRKRRPPGAHATATTTSTRAVRTV
ncbi:hypothetical protein [Streptomyces roseoverticillatus]|uniref:hypothetical protein n=1 Tax=Streptomyces roseoverticillatus TaxID=66429 RepID=UPI0004BECE8F|nr:hypothetical protein [Streptomyces roseoverticillatus]